MFICGEPMKPATNVLAGALGRLERRSRSATLTFVVQHHDAGRPSSSSLNLIVRDVDDGQPELALDAMDLGARKWPRNWRRGLRAARPSGGGEWLQTLRASATMLALAPPESSRGLRLRYSVRPSISAGFREALLLLCRHLAHVEAEEDICRAPSCAGRARSSEIPSRGCGPSAASRSRFCRRASACRRDFLKAGDDAQQRDLPHPDGPTRDEEFALRTSRLMPSRNSFASFVLTTSRISILFIFGSFLPCPVRVRLDAGPGAVPMPAAYFASSRPEKVHDVEVGLEVAAVRAVAVLVRVDNWSVTQRIKRSALPAFLGGGAEAVEHGDVVLQCREQRSDSGNVRCITSSYS